MKYKKGVSLIEVMIAMGIFSAISAMTIAIFISMLNMKTMSSNMKESQQKLRISLEMVTRLSRQANRIVVRDNNREVELFYTNPGASIKFNITPVDSTNYKLTMSDCTTLTGRSCASWKEPTDLVSGLIKLNSNSKFEKKTYGDLSALLIRLDGRITGINFTKDAFNIETEVLMESER